MGFRVGLEVGKVGGKMVNFLVRLVEVIEHSLTYLAVTSTFIMMCLTTADSIGRYLFNRPIVGAYEIAANYLMVATVFLGICYAHRQGANIRVTFLVDRLPLKVQTVMGCFAQGFAILLILILVIATAKQALRSIAEGSSFTTLPLSQSPAYCVIPVGLFFMSCLMILDLRRLRKRKPEEKSPTTN
jgi:TRAP-type C4-dicarboxylate transport system permease small subunit